MAFKKELDFYNHPIESFLFFDIETASRDAELEEGTPQYDAFIYKMRYAEEAQRKDFNSYNVKALYAEKAALYPEFGRVVCITVGKILNGELEIYTFRDEDEATMLTKFNTFLGDRVAKDPNLALCGVNLKFFDIRYIFIRSIIHQVKPVPNHINLTGMKPWDVRMLDITDVWKQTSPYNAPLVVMAECLGLPSPKEALDGSMVSKVYHSEGKEGLDKIVKYCELDVYTTANIALKLRLEPTVEVAGKTKAVKAKAKTTKTKAVKKVAGPKAKKEEAPVGFAGEEPTELPHVLARIYNLNMFDETMEAEIKKIIGRKKLTKANKEHLKDILLGIYLRTDFVNADQDSKAVREQKTEEIDNFIKTL